MDEGLVESFAAAAREVFREIGLEVSGAGSQPDAAPAADSRMVFVATVGVLGDVRGSLLLRLDRFTASNIVAAMYRSLGLEDRQPPEIAEAAIAEVANQICGRAVTILSRKSVECDITPPAVISGTELTSSLPGSVGLAYRFVEGPFGSLFISLGLKA
jgi:chemotaxis protein CheX